MVFEIILTAVFVAAVVFAFLRKPKDSSVGNFPFVAAAVFLLAFLLRLYLGYFTEGFSVDIDDFKAWGMEIAGSGFSGLYQRDGLFLDYPPGYLYILWLLEKLRTLLGIPVQSQIFTLMIKLPAIFADLFIGLGLLLLGRKKIGEMLSIFVTSAYLFCPVVLLDSAQWGQVDSICTLLLFASVYLLYRGNYIPASILYGISLISKPQMLVFAPLYIFFAIRERKYIKLVLCMGLSLLTALLIAAPFTVNFDFSWLLTLYGSTLDEYAYYSVNAYNIWTVLGLNWEILPGGFLETLLTYVPAVLATALCGWIVLKSRYRESVFSAPIILMGIMYLLSVKMHERYIYPAFLFFLVLFIFLPDRNLPRYYAAVTAGNYLNVSYVLHIFNTVGNAYDPNSAPSRILAVLQTLALLYGISGVAVLCLGKKGVEELSTEPLTFKRKPGSSGEGPNISDALGKDSKTIRLSPKWDELPRWKKTDTFAVLAITVLYGIIAFWALGERSMPQTNWVPAEGESVVLEADEPVDVVYYLPALAPDDNHYAARTGANFQVEVSEDGVNFTDAGILSQNADSGDTDYVYSWGQHSLGTSGKYVRLTALDGISVLGEVGLRPAFSHEFSSVTAGAGGENLVDEQETVPLYKSYMTSSYFDEIYHARTAYEHILGLEPYENTHPPLGKYIIALGILIFGMNPFGWRFMGTLFGVLMLPVLYHLLKQIFGKTSLAAFGTIWFAFDFMHFTQTRIATIDTYAVFFLLLMYDAMVVFLRKDVENTPLTKLLPPLLICGIFTGLGIASKWTAAYGALGLAVLFFGKFFLAYRKRTRDKRDRKIFLNRMLKVCLWCCLFFIAIPFGIYFCAFLPVTTLPHNRANVFGNFWRYQLHMYNYHSGLQATHYFASPWYEWPFDVRPIWFFSNSSAVDLISPKYSTISSFGSPLLWWSGLAAVIYAVYAWVKRRSPYAAVALCGYLSVFLPWVLVPRLTFIYHYFTAVPFLVISLTGAADLFIKSKPGSRTLNAGTLSIPVSTVVLWVFTALILISFILFYPVLSGLPVNRSYTESLRFFSTWYF